VLGRGTIEFLHSDNRKVLAFLRVSDEERLLVVANLSRFVQCTELDLSRCEEAVPVEVFGQTRFPVISRDPYFLTLAPHSFYWLSLERAVAEAEPAPAGLPVVALPGSWERAFQDLPAEWLERALARWFPQQRWFGSDARGVLGVRVADVIPIDADGESQYLTILEVSYTDGDPDLCFLPLALATGEEADRQLASGAAVARVRRRDGTDEGVLYDAVASGALARWMLEILPSRRRPRGHEGAIATTAFTSMRDAVREGAPGGLEPMPLGRDRRNPSVVYGNRFILKLFRRLDDGVSPELEVGRFLTTRAHFPHAPALVGAVEYRRPEREPVTIGVVHEFVPHAGDGWRYTLDAVDHFFEFVLTGNAELGVSGNGLGPIVTEEPVAYPPFIIESAGMYLESARLLGQRTAELHLALGSRTDEPRFAPEPFTALYQRSLYQSLRAKADQALTLLASRARTLPPEVQDSADAVLAARDTVTARLRAVTQRPLTGMRIRCHGDYSLEKVLHTGRDFVILDFEGEPSRTLEERRLKRSPLVDVAGMLRSFDYAAVSALIDGRVRPEDIEILRPWADEWRYWVSRAFVDAYVRTAMPSGLLPRIIADLRLLLECYQLEKALYEVAWELNRRPAWTRIPLRGVRDILEGTGPELT